jgi:hypothetical protein
VLCYECHGFKFPKTISDGDRGFKTIEIELSEFEQKRCTTPLPIEEGKRITFCDKCGQDIQVYDTVAVEHNLVKKLRDFGIDAFMEQTGGMNSACCVYKKYMGPLEKDTYPPYFMATFNWDGDDVWYIGSYDELGDWVEEEGVSFDNEKDIVNWFLENNNIMTIVGDNNGR